MCMPEVVCSVLFFPLLFFFWFLRVVRLPRVSSSDLLLLMYLSFFCKRKSDLEPHKKTFVLTLIKAGAVGALPRLKDL